MKIKKIIIFILAMLVIFSLPTSYAKNAVPAGNASKAEIEKYMLFYRIAYVKGECKKKSIIIQQWLKARHTSF